MAYAFYEACGRIDGYVLEDWLKAEVHVAQEEPAARDAPFSRAWRARLRHP